MLVIFTGTSLENNILTSGDTIGAFKKIDDDYLCVGNMMWTGQTNTLAIWGNDQVSNQIDGYYPGDTIKLMTRIDDVIYKILFDPSILYSTNGTSNVSNELLLSAYCDTMGSIFGCTNEGT
jgi:hypothetical protein